MATTYRSRFLGVMRDAERDMGRMFSSLAAASSQELLRFAGPDGTIPIESTFEIQRAVSERVTRVFLSRIAAGERQPFRVLSDGSVMPLSPYARILWGHIESAVRLPVEQHASLVERRLPPDLLQSMRRSTRIPVASEQIGLRQNPLAQYDPPHLWVDPNGYRLSDRIWLNSGRTRRRLDMFLEERIAQGQGALEMSRDLERFLQPGRKLLRTGAPYGTDASFDAMRLARTEITRAHARAQEVAARINPFVEGLSVTLSLSHPQTDICDDAAAESPFPKDEIPAIYQIPLHPHCLCYYRNEMIEDRQAVIDELRADVRRARGELSGWIGQMLTGELVRRLLTGVQERALA